MAGLLLAVVLVLNAAVVLPVWHALWHDDHGCDEPDCIVLALAQGTVDPSTPPSPVVRPVIVELPASAIPFLPPVSADDCPSLPARAPPV